MDTINLISRIAGARYQQLCPECGAKMTETDRVCENGTMYVWYKCSRDTCTGQWLQKTPHTSSSLSGVGHMAGAI